MGASDRGPSVSWRSLGAARGLLAILVVGLAFRLIIAYVLLPGSGFGVDRASFIAWASDLAAHGPSGFYGRVSFIDYTPGYLYVLWLVGTVGSWLGGIGDLIKLPAILADMAVGYLIHQAEGVFDIDTVFAGILVLTIFALILDFAVTKI